MPNCWNSSFYRALECLEMLWEQQSPSRVGVHPPNDHDLLRPGRASLEYFCREGGTTFQPFPKKHLWDTSARISPLTSIPGKGRGNPHRSFRSALPQGFG